MVYFQNQNTNQSVGPITKALYSFVELDSRGNIIPGSIFELDVVSDIGYNNPNSIVTYETVGGDGGYSISTGRLTQTVTLTVHFISNVPYGISKDDVAYKRVSKARDQLDENLQKLSKLKNLRKPMYIFKLNYGGGQKFFGRYLIKNISGGIKEADRSLAVNIDLVEYKDLTIKKNLVYGTDLMSTLVEVDAIKDRLKARNILL